MAYTAIENDSLAPGTPGSATVWHTLTDNHDAAYEEYAPPIAACAVDVTIDATSATTVLRFQMPANEDNEDLAVWVRWKMDSGPTLSTMTVLVDSSSIGTITTTSTSFTNQTLTGTPTGTGTREVEIQLHRTGGSGGDNAYIEAVCLYLSPAAPAAGILSSGFIRADSGWYTADQPIPSERAARLLNGPPLIARDRPACVFTMAQDLAGGAGRRWAESGSSYALVFRCWVANARNEGAGLLRLYAYPDGTSTAVAHTLVEYGSQTWALTANGWATTTVYPVEGGGWLSIWMKVGSGSGDAYPGALQIWREPGT
jgi:hypothetical protein